MTHIADEYEYIKSRMEEIKAERNKPAPEYQALEPVETDPGLYLGWDTSNGGT